LRGETDGKRFVVAEGGFELYGTIEKLQVIEFKMSTKR
jgi:hypothetical protein